MTAKLTKAAIKVMIVFLEKRTIPRTVLFVLGQFVSSLVRDEAGESDGVIFHPLQLF